MGSTGYSLIRNCLFIFNLVFFLAGLGLIITGALVQTKFREYFEFSDSVHLTAVGVFIIVIGVIIFLIGFFGCCGAYKENYCMLITFSVLLGTVFILEIAAIITVYVMRDKVKGQLQTTLLSSVNKYNVSGGVTKAWNTLQTKFKCCGLTNYTDWAGNSMLNASDSVPDSCCKKVTANCGYNKLKGSLPPKGINTDPCLDEFTSFVKKNIYAIGGVSIAFAVLQVIGICLACYYAHHVKKGYEEVE